MTKPPPPKKKPKSDAQVVADALWYLEAFNEMAGGASGLVETITDLRALLSRMMKDGGGGKRGEETR